MVRTPAATDATSDLGVSSNDTIIAVYGVTGSGKSTLIEMLTGRTGLSGDSVESVTSEITPFRITRKKKSVVFVDTPGFDDTHKTDLEVLMMLAEWLKKTYRKGALLSGIIYVHPIASNRFNESARKNLRMFERLCGKDALHKVVLLTTMWDLMERDAAVKREAELNQKFWRPLQQSGMKYQRLEPSTPEHAWEILEDHLLNSNGGPSPILLQEELVSLERKLKETTAGKELYKEAEDTLKRHKELLAHWDSMWEGDKATILEAHKRVQAIFEEVHAKKIPIHRRVLSMFSKNAKSQ